MKKGLLQSLWRNTRLVWALSYLLIMVVPMAAFIPIYSSSLSMIQSQIYKVRQNELERIGASMNGKLEEMERISLEVLTDVDVASMVPLKGSLTAQNSFTLYQIHKKLKAITVYNRSIENIVVFLDGVDRAIYKDGADKIAPFLTALVGKKGDSAQRLHKSLVVNGGSQYLILESQARENLTRYLVHLQSICSASGDNHLVVMVILKPEAVPLINQEAERVCAYIRDSAGAVYPLQHDGGVPIEDAMQLTLASGKGDLQYYYEMDRHDFYGMTDRIRIITIFSLCACVGFGIFAAWYLSRKNYHPVLRIINMLRKDSVQPASFDGFSFIESNMQKLFQRQEVMVATLDRQKSVLKDYFIIRLLNGKIQDLESVRMLSQSYGLEFTDSFFVVALFKIESVPENQKMEQDQIFTRYTIKSSIEAELKGLYAGAAIEVDDNLVCLVNVSEDAAAHAAENILILAEQVRLNMRERFQETISATISEVHPLIELVEAYGEAVTLMEYCTLMDSDFAVRHRFTTQDIQSGTWAAFCAEQNRKFKNFIKVSDYDGAKLSLEQFLQGCEKCSSSVQIRFELVNFLHILLAENGRILNFTASKEQEVIKRLMFCRDVREMTGHLTSLLEQAQNASREMDTQHEVMLREQVERYVYKHYSDKNLSVTEIADSISFSIPQFSRLFKQQSGKGPLHFIHEVRISKAKELLADDALTIAQIADLTGFNDASALIRVFKQSEGASPGRYRKMLHEQ